MRISKSESAVDLPFKGMPPVTLALRGLLVLDFEGFVSDIRRPEADGGTLEG